MLAGHWVALVLMLFSALGALLAWAGDAPTETWRAALSVSLNMWILARLLLLERLNSAYQAYAVSIGGDVMGPYEHASRLMQKTQSVEVLRD